MAIQNRRGVYNDFDPSKMVEGEFAVVKSGDPNTNDGTSVYIATNTGSVKRVALFEDIVQEIESATEEVVQDFVEQVSGDVERAETAAEAAEEAASTFTVDSELSNSSTHPVQNKVINSEITALKEDLSEFEDIAETVTGERNIYNTSFTSEKGVLYTIPINIIAGYTINIDVANAEASQQLTIKTKNNGSDAEVIFDRQPIETSFAISFTTTQNADSIVFYTNRAILDFNVSVIQVISESLKDSIMQNTSDISEVSNYVFGYKEIEYDIKEGMFINTNYHVITITGYSICYFPMEQGKKYRITEQDYQVFRFGTLNSIPVANDILNDAISPTEGTCEYTNTSGYLYGVATLATSLAPNPTVSVSEILPDSLNEKLEAIEELDNKLEQQRIDLDNGYVSIVDSGNKLSSNGSTLSIDESGNFNLMIYHGTKTVYLNLSDIETNNNFADSTNFVLNKSFFIKDAVVVNIKIVLDDIAELNNLSEIAIVFKKPGESSTAYTIITGGTKADFPNGIFERDIVISSLANETIGSLCLYLKVSTNNTVRFSGNIKSYSIDRVISRFSQNGVGYQVGSGTEYQSYMSRGDCKTNGKLTKDGIYIVNSVLVPVELRGVGLHSISQYKNLHSWESFYSLKRYGVNLIRLSVYLDDNVFSASDGETAHGYIQHVEETKAHIEYIVKQCIDLGIYVLLDWHHWSDHDGKLVNYQSQAESFFNYYSTKYANVPNVLYEICNEPYSDTTSEVVAFTKAIRNIIVANVVDPVMVTGYTMFDNNNDRYSNITDACTALYDELVEEGITDVFISPHNYGYTILSHVAALRSNGVPIFVSEWGNSMSSGDGPGDDQFARDTFNFYHVNCVPHSVWKFTDQTMTTSLLKNRGMIDSQKYFYGFEKEDFSHNGAMLFGRYKDFVTSEWIEREPLND